MIRVGVSYHGGGAGYDAYAAALGARASCLSIGMEIAWLAGIGRPFSPHRLLGVHALCLTGGEDFGVAPERDAIETALIEHAAGKSLPLLAICRGAQIVNVVSGGSLLTDLADRNAVHRAPPPKAHSVAIRPGTLLSSVTGAAEARVNSSHHQAVDRLGADFRACAFSPDGVVEAYEYAEPAPGWFLAVQWHPELPGSSPQTSDAVLDAFLRAAEREAASVPRGTLRA
ncbi:MAG: gamma-glutamyl-gamma-aminobutyrate hydrolase family protein [Candidatus Baltobacteraceae bacterium]